MTARTARELSDWIRKKVATDIEPLTEDDCYEIALRLDRLAALEAKPEPTEQEVVADQKPGLPIRPGHGSNTATPPATPLAPGADAAMPRRAEDGGWLPIESAPKDGARLLVAGKKGWIAIGCYLVGFGW